VEVSSGVIQVEKLEAMLDDLESQLHQSTQLQEATEAELEETQEKLKQTEAELTASVATAAAAAAATSKKVWRRRCPDN
jgi:predicted  nucleic acid-binding Zn-ribbon protein